MTDRTARKLLVAFLALLVPIAWLAAKFDAYQIDGDAVNYLDIAGYLRAHHWAAIVNSYWHPGYPAVLAAAQSLLHTTRWTELHAASMANYGIFLAEAAAIWWLTSALVRLRTRMASATGDLLAGQPLLSANALRLLGLGLLVIAANRELSLGKVRPDALLQALMLAAFAALVTVLGSESLWAAPLIGIFFGLAYLTKSFAFAIALLSIFALVVFGIFFARRSLRWAAGAALLTVLPFALIAGPYVSALSHKFHRLDFGDSGSLNFAWYVTHTEKMHLEPSMSSEFGDATVHLQHPEQQLLVHPGVYSYQAVPFGTYPDWFDTAYFNERVTPHTHLGPLLHRDLRNLVLVVRYLFNHPESLVLGFALLLLGSRLSLRGWRRSGFWIPTFALGLAMWAIYGLVNIEERYVTLAFLLVILTLFAMLRAAADDSSQRVWQQHTATALIALFSFLALGEMLRVSLEERRLQPAGVPTWRDPKIFSAAEALNALGIGSGDQIACMGVTACLHDYYWARLADVRITSEIYAPESRHLLAAWQDLPEAQRLSALRALHEAGARVLVAYFGPGEAAHQSAEASGWRQLGETPYFALPVTATLPAPAPVATTPWIGHAEGNQ
ncbi:MAG: hypothetical protein PW735_02665 [Acidobacteriaceae bacterium]|nr:hypothetical protein [Acidobacteriaceae bacterium]